MRTRVFVAVVLGAVLAMGTWASAQQGGQQQQPMGPMGQGGMGQGQPGSGMGPGGMMGGQGPQGGMGMGPGMMGPGQGMGPGGMMGPGQAGGSPFERPLITEILSAKDQLNLTADQERRLRALRVDFEKDWITRGAEIRAAEVDLRELLAAEAPDLGKVEGQVKKIAALQGELRFARIKVLQEGRAVLSREQWQKFQALAPRPGPMGPGRGRRQSGQQGSQMGPGMMGGTGQGMMGGMGQGGMMGPGAGPGPAGGDGATRTDATGPVTVIATLLPVAGDRVRFEDKLDTHSVELDGYQLEAGVSLRNDRGASAPAAVESPSGSGHHRAVTVAFPASVALGAKYVELVVRDLGGVQERTLRWDGPWANR